MSINPLIPYIPAILSFFIYGYLSGFLFLLWKRSRWGCLLTIVFWYLYAVWCIFFGLLLGVESTERQIWFVLGVVLSFLRPLLQSIAVQHFIEDITHASHLGRRAWQSVTRSRTNKTSSDSQSHANQNNQHSYNDSNEQARRTEQVRREAEARARRAEKEQSQKSKAEDPPPEPPKRPKPPTTDNRSPEEILSLRGNWTQEDLRTAYKREAGRTHPDKWIGKPEAIRHAMEEEFKSIQQAYDQLKI